MLRAFHRKSRRGEGGVMAVARAGITSIGAAHSPVLGAAMLAPAVLYILLLAAGPFMLASFYAFRDARIGNTQLHFLRLEDFRSMLQRPTFRVAVRNSFIFPICLAIVRIIA